MKKTKYRRVLWLLPLLCAAALIPLFLRGSFPRLEVAGFRIEEQEYLQAMYQARNQVLSDHAAAGISLTDWDRETPLGDPRELTVQRALEILAEYYAVSTLAVERGYLADAGYDAMLRELEQTNRQRKDALASGTIITGIPSFTVEDFLAYRASSLRLEFTNDPDQPENQVTEEEILERYEADRDALYRQPDSMELAYIAIDAAPGEIDALEQALLALSPGSLSEALEAQPGLKPYYAEASIQPENYSFYDRTISDVLALAAGLQPGERSGVIRQGERLYLVECLDRTVHSYVPLEEVSSVVAQSIRESRYNALIAARAEQLPVQVDPDRLYRFTAEQLP
jgi:hypothetical protein